MFDMNASVVGKIGGGEVRGELAEMNRRKQQDPQALALQAQVAEKKRREEAEWLRDREETLAHLQNYQLGGKNAETGLDNLIAGAERRLGQAKAQFEAHGGLGDQRDDGPRSGLGVKAQPSMNPITAANMAQRAATKQQLFSDNKVQFGSNAGPAAAADFGMAAGPSGALGGESERERRLRERRSQRGPAKKVVISSSAAARQAAPAQQQPAAAQHMQQPPSHNMQEQQYHPPQQQAAPPQGMSKRDQVYEEKRRRRAAAKSGGGNMAGGRVSNRAEAAYADEQHGAPDDTEYGVQPHEQQVQHGTMQQPATLPLHEVEARRKLDMNDPGKAAPAAKTGFHTARGPPPREQQTADAGREPEHAARQRAQQEYAAEMRHQHQQAEAQRATQHANGGAADGGGFGGSAEHSDRQRAQQEYAAEMRHQHQHAAQPVRVGGAARHSRNRSPDRKAQEPAEDGFFKFGQAGAGAPLRDRDGKIITSRRPDPNEVAHTPTRQNPVDGYDRFDRVHHSPVAHPQKAVHFAGEALGPAQVHGAYGQPQPPADLHAAGPGSAAPSSYTPGFSSVGMGQEQGVPGYVQPGPRDSVTGHARGAPAKILPTNELQAELFRQMEIKKAEAERKKREEEEEELRQEQKLARQREEIQREFEAEQRAKEKKENDLKAELKRQMDEKAAQAEADRVAAERAEAADEARLARQRNEISPGPKKVAIPSLRGDLFGNPADKADAARSPGSDSPPAAPRQGVEHTPIQQQPSGSYDQSPPNSADGEPRQRRRRAPPRGPRLANRYAEEEEEEEEKQEHQEHRQEDENSQVRRQRRASANEVAGDATEGPQLQAMNHKLQSALDELAHLRVDLEQQRKDREADARRAELEAQRQAAVVAEQQAAVAAAQQRAAAEMAALAMQQHAQQAQVQQRVVAASKLSEPGSANADEMTASVTSAASSRPDWLRKLDNTAVPDVDLHDLPESLAEAAVNETAWGNGKGPRAALAEAIRRAELMMRQGGGAARQARYGDDWLDDGVGVKVGGEMGAASINLAQSLVSDSKFIFPVHAQQTEWGTLKSPGLEPEPAADSAVRRPSSGRRAPKAAPRAYEESRLVYPDANTGGEWGSLASGRDATAVATAPAATTASVGGRAVVSLSADGPGGLGGSLGEDSVDLLLARNEERLRRLDGIST